MEKFVRELDHLKRYCSIHFSYKYFDFGHWWATQCPTRMFVGDSSNGFFEWRMPELVTSFNRLLLLLTSGIHFTFFFLLDALHYVVNCCHGKRRTPVESDTLAKGDWHLWELTLPFKPQYTHTNSPN